MFFIKLKIVRYNSFEVLKQIETWYKCVLIHLKNTLCVKEIVKLIHF